MIREIQSRPEVSIVVPLFNESGNVETLVSELSAVLRSERSTFEIILVDDGSGDDTWSRIRRAQAFEPAVRGISLLRNFGHQSALLAGLEAAEGRAVVTMDGDLQHPPAMIPELLAAWREGHTVVQTRRRDSFDTTLFKRWSSKAFYRVFSLLSGLEMTPGMSDFRLLDRSAIDILLGMKDPELFLRGRLQWVGGPSLTLPYQAAERHAGESKYSLGRMLKLSTSALVSFSTVPLKLGIWLGLATSGLAFLEILYIVWAWSRGQTVPGWASVLTVMSFMFGVLFILLGILGTYLASIHGALQQRPAYLVEETLERASSVRRAS